MTSRSRSISARRLGTFVLRNELSADLGNLVLVRFAERNEIGVSPGIDAALEFFYGELGNSVLHEFSRNDRYGSNHLRLF